MPAMQHSFKTSGEWSVFTQMREVLLTPRFERIPEQNSGGKTACSNCSISKCAEQRGHFAVRRPDADETPLSEAERLVAIRECITCS